jgi:hypothetical protein
MGLLYLICRSSKVFFIQRMCVQQDATTMCYASTIDSDVDVCLFFDHATTLFPKKNVPPLVISLSSMLAAQSALAYVVRLNYLSFGYHNPSSRVP